MPECIGEKHHSISQRWRGSAPRLAETLTDLTSHLNRTCLAPQNLRWKGNRSLAPRPPTHDWLYSTHLSFTGRHPTKWQEVQTTEQEGGFFLSSSSQLSQHSPPWSFHLSARDALLGASRGGWAAPALKSSSPVLCPAGSASALPSGPSAPAPGSSQPSYLSAACFVIMAPTLTLSAPHTHWHNLPLSCRRTRGDTGWDGWMASPTQCTWVWASSGCWWWTGRPGVLQSMGLQRAGHNEVSLITPI